MAEIEAAHPDVAETGFRVEVEGAAPASFHVDRVHLAEIFRNLFEVATRAPRARVRRDGDTLQISLTDSGPALTEVDRAAVFAAFSAADPRLRRPSGGKSLRLTIARARARLLGGELSLENEADSGSCFVLRLPLRA